MKPLKLAGYITNNFITKREPFSLVHFVTDRCNARCPHCFMDFSRSANTGSLLSLSEITKMTKNMGKNLYNVNLTGGEPFLREDLFDIVSAYFENSTLKSIIITTNGTLVSTVRLFVEKLIRLDFRGQVKISVSIDNLGEKHDASRKFPGAFNKALETYALIESCGDSRLMADIALTVTPYNYADITDVYSTLREMGIHNFSAILMRKEGIINALEQQDEVLKAYLDLAYKLQTEQPLLKTLSAGHRVQEAVRGAKNRIAADMQADRQTGGANIRCQAGKLFGIIYPNGDVYPCEILGTSSCLGNLRDNDMDFLRLWSSEKTSTLLRRIDRHQCNSCTYECALSVNILTSPSLLPRMLALSCRNILWR